MIYLIFTVSIAHLSGFKLRQQQQQQQQQQQAQSNHTGINRSTTMALQTQLHLLNCLEALTSISGTWELARRCWRTLDKLMDMEGLKPKPAAPEPSRNPGPVEVVGLGKRKRDDGVEDTELGGSSRLPLITSQFWGGQERTINPPAPHGGDISSFSQGGINQSQSLMGWNPSSGGDLTDHSVSASMPISAESFDLSAFASARWLPEVLNVPEAVPVGLDGVWDGEWDEGFWAQSLHFGLDGGG
ncbi:hypothetical protein BDZ94DRAFT_1252657 [Collybia nuda]|uniref:Uncharacterized protein n=1 Tax=Collybia nuda TaxID=64659 RepID=A0A9P6CH21_9AGAR|nr:hypothetical protein BDZ94DRAFT_1252657 [Collybia nuda]